MDRKRCLLVTAVGIVVIVVVVITAVVVVHTVSTTDIGEHADTHDVANNASQQNSDKEMVTASPPSSSSTEIINDKTDPPRTTEYSPPGENSPSKTVSYSVSRPVSDGSPPIPTTLETPPQSTYIGVMPATAGQPPEESLRVRILVKESRDGRVNASLNDNLTMTCLVRGADLSTNVTWRHNDSMLVQTNLIKISSQDRTGNRIHSTLKILEFHQTDVGLYECSAVRGNSKSSDNKTVFAVYRKGHCDEDGYCLNEATCKVLGPDGPHSCVCTSNFTGKRCERRKLDLRATALSVEVTRAVTPHTKHWVWLSSVVTSLLILVILATAITHRITSNERRRGWEHADGSNEAVRETTPLDTPSHR